MERWQAARAAAGKEVGTAGSLCDGMAWLYGRLDEHEAALKPGGEPVYAFRKKGLDDFCTCDARRYLEFKNKPHMFEVTIFYRAAPPAQAPVPPRLTEEEMLPMWGNSNNLPVLGKNKVVEFASAIESAVRKQWAKHFGVNDE
jgi:hypothetical protein